MALERAQVAVVVERQVAHARPGRRVGDDHAELGVAEARRADAPGGAADLLAQDAAQADGQSLDTDGLQGAIGDDPTSLDDDAEAAEKGGEAQALRAAACL